MEQFSLEKYLENPSRQVVTRDGKSVNIIYDHMKGLAPIIALIQWNENDEHCFMYDSKGRCASNEATLDLFFADEEEELTEFEKELEMMMVSFSNSNVGSDIRTEMPKDKLYNYSHRLLDLARKELEKNYRLVDKNDSNWEDGYKQGICFALKDLPKWKKDDNRLSSGVYSIENRGDGNIVVCIKDYTIQLSELIQKLPKEK